MQPQDIPLTHVFVRDDARKIDEAAVRGLVDSIREVGIINPLRVRPARKHVEGVETDAYEVTCGGHRLRAARLIGLETIPCNVVDEDDVHAELAMLDENLKRKGYGSPAEEAIATNRRKELYAILHPEVRHGGHRAASRKACDLDGAERFTANTASATGQSERAVQLAAERGARIGLNVLEMVAHTSLDTGAYLDRLKKLEPKDQEIRVARALERARKTQRPASDPLTNEEASEKQVARLMSAWNAASPDARQEFLLRIDSPVMDAGGENARAFA